MIVSRDPESDINIHITGTGPRSVKRPSAKQENKLTPPKKPRLEPSSISPSKADLKNAVTEPATALHRTSDVSFRHLFSFANTSQSDGPQRKRNSAQDAKQAFAFLDEKNEVEQRVTVDANEESRFLGPSMHVLSIATPETRPETEHNQGTQQSARNSDPVSGRESPQRCKPYRDIGGATGPNQFLYRSKNSHFQRHQVELERSPSSDILMIPEDIDSRPDQILQIATRFCRPKSVEQLEEDWCAPGGLRETMRRDFKQKRQNVIRGRKLGSSSKR